MKWLLLSQNGFSKEDVMSDSFDPKKFSVRLMQSSICFR